MSSNYYNYDNSVSLSKDVVGQGKARFVAKRFNANETHKLE